MNGLHFHGTEKLVHNALTQLNDKRLKYLISQNF